MDEPSFPLTKAERLILRNQFRILSYLDVSEKDNYAKAIEILEQGYAARYIDMFERFSNDMPVESAYFVIDVLQMYRQLTFSTQNLEAKGESNVPSIVFEGFDSSTETTLMSYAGFVLNIEGDYGELHGVNNASPISVNSLRPMAGKYTRMLAVWRNMGKPLRGSLTKEQISAILGA